MAKFRRFITYLFRYEDGEKKEQKGYAKVEQRQSMGSVDIHLKNCKEGLVEIRPYFFARGVRVPIGTISIKNRAADGSFRFESENLGNLKLCLQDMRGLIIPIDENEVLFSQWDDEEYPWEELINWEAKEEHDQSFIQESPKEQLTLLKREQVEMLEERETESMENREHTAADIDTVEIKPQRLNWEDRFQQKTYPFQGDVDTWAISAQLRDLRYLPEEHWTLRNNSFVLRGYYKYGKILIGQMGEEKRWFIGVPGVFFNQEKIIAGMFGFDCFKSKAPEGEKPGAYGFWCHFLNMDENRKDMKIFHT